MFAGKIAIIGSTNMDMVVRTERIPVPEAPTLASQFLCIPEERAQTRL
ncbi:MAG: hypothetical protein J7599_11055 [Niabella sp.]|nr:hypothetical protein [Niabella sp.]